MVALESGIAHHNNKDTQGEGVRGGEAMRRGGGRCLCSAWVDRKATAPPVVASGSDADATDRLYTDECLKTVKAQVISHFHGQVVQTALSVDC